ncbi:hypothetical protein E6O75_ATG00563 [Venturia nashicola]|uniref:Uncharacterized protein n=1 Tax=Venturia nashicola TaxID=86259 RepID=A0A4Z1PGR9_9PEZI|nr:hypothetical protein E6O75_ATG00563 [Venturia nashicola]
MTSPLQRKPFESHLTTSPPPWIDLLHQLPIDLSDYTSFLASYSDIVLSPLEDELRIEDLLEDELFEDSKEEPTDTVAIMSNNQSQCYSGSIFTSSSNGGAPQIWRSTESISSNSQGTTVHQTSEQPGHLPRQETLRLGESSESSESGESIAEQPASSSRIEDISEPSAWKTNMRSEKEAYSVVFVGDK